MELNYLGAVTSQTSKFQKKNLSKILEGHVHKKVTVVWETLNEFGDPLFTLSQAAASASLEVGWTASGLFATVFGTPFRLEALGVGGCPLAVNSTGVLTTQSVFNIRSALFSAKRQQVRRKQKHLLTYKPQKSGLLQIKKNKPCIWRDLVKKVLSC